MSSTANTTLSAVLLRDTCRHCGQSIELIHVDTNWVWRHTIGLYSCAVAYAAKTGLIDVSHKWADFSLAEPSTAPSTHDGLPQEV